VKRDAYSAVRQSANALCMMQHTARSVQIHNRMNLLILAAGVYTPIPLKRRKLLELFACTAEAFGCEAPPAQGQSHEELLDAYARFTAAQASPAQAPEIRLRLYDGALRMGRELRRTFRVRDTADALAAARVLYRALGIDLRAGPDGEITVRRCFFSAYYSAPVCRLIASLDEGLFAGLSDGGRLAFSQRITEGCECCRARLSLRGGEGSP
jgi:hypothetical protein